ncbi:acyl-CoA dehydrogenase family protein [Tepidiforma sp.]|mgnify:FL=1|jgi:alkylation response protein AidB-like acyl-CoA dehydrogenase|uniref:acyl-CoA dehydrogenase family protein n=1 Tax=Tepidiforma sp. TaxID=2682230 RepID=UPI0021DCE6B5|nr:acyl-CoA dehydrogenase family protein [Tepidiforma sp.]MCX7617097.1 acyl-CoA dehydrogenase family protein [Tepidiforma sp.]GIW17049.1 MAG: acyl-CoA dehydrogenase [Tepidiforma sp.]
MAINLGDNEREAAWRKEVREFIEKEAPAALRAGGEGGEGSLFARMGAIKEWRDKLAAKGWIAPAWPKKYGGADMTVVEQFIMNEEFAEAGVPANVGGFGVMMIGPTLIEHGTEEQKEEHLGKILRGEVIWCQGYSEPGAGSDLASLQTRAVRDGDDYVINGQKIWTTGAQFADWMYMLVRTDPDAPKHRGITYLLVDMKSPGITVRPLTTLAGTQTFNEVFFEDVRVPVKNRVGEENRGWYVGTTTLDFERSSIGSAVGIRKQLEGLMRQAKEGKEAKFRSDTVRREFADRWIEAEVAKMLSYRVVSMQAAGKIPNYEASMCKLFTSELSQRIANLSMHLYGMYGNVRNRASMGYMQAVSATIAGGTTEVQKNIIATRGLGLPRG